MRFRDAPLVLNDMPSGLEGAPMFGKGISYALNGAQVIPNGAPAGSGRVP